MYAAPQGVTRQQANKQRLAEVERLSSSLRDVVELLRQGSEADAAVALRRIRQADQVDDAVNVLAVARALVAPASANENAPGFDSRPDEASSTDPLRPLVERSISSSCVSESLQAM